MVGGPQDDLALRRSEVTFDGSIKSDGQTFAFGTTSKPQASAAATYYIDSTLSDSNHQSPWSYPWLRQ